MHRIRLASLRWSSLLLAVLVGARAVAAEPPPTPAPAAAVEEFMLGRDYQAVTPPQPVADSSKIEVLEVFWYGCPHCFDFEPYVAKWLADKPDDVDFKRVPAAFNKRWQLHARTYYAAEALGVLDKIHAPLFKAIHEEKQTLADEESLAGFFAKQGVSADDFKQTLSSFGVEGKLQQAQTMVRRYGITGVPAMVVNGKYVAGATAGTFANMLKIVDFLVAKERGEKKAAVPAAESTE
ncbi:MAG: thiol:disulfide interchange protein DsbA/DsbL [Gammaproteobacteria bacterium]